MRSARTVSTEWWGGYQSIGLSWGRRNAYEAANVDYFFMKLGSELYRERRKLNGGGISNIVEWVGTEQKEEYLPSETG